MFIFNKFSIRIQSLLHLYFIFLSAIVFGIYFLNFYYLTKTNIVYLYTQIPTFLILVITAINIEIGLNALLILFAFSPQIMNVIFTTIFKISYVGFDYPGIDLFCVFVVIYLFKRKIISLFFNFNNQFYTRISKLITILTLFHSYLVFSSGISILRSLNQTTSYLIFKGIWFHVKHIRILNWHSDYHALKELFIYSLAICVCYVIYDYLYSNKKNIFNLIPPILIGNVLMLMISFLLSVIIHQYPHVRNYKGFFPDIHSFGSFEYFCLISSGLAFYKTHKWTHKIFYIFSLLLSLIALILSGSRFTILSGTILLIIWSYWYLKNKIPLILLKILSILATIILLIVFIWFCYISSYKFQTLFKDNFYKLNFNKINYALSHRPEILISSFYMYKQYPIIGVGLGSFYRNSSFIEFSKSQFFESHNGENAHCYPLQLLVEVGIIGFIIWIFIIFVPRSGPLFIPTNILILSIMAGNIFSHSLLEKEMLCLFFILIAAHHLYCEQNFSLKTFNFFKNKNTRILYVFIFLLFILFGFNEIIKSFYKEPFYYGKKCFQISYTPSKDNWVRGLWLLTINNLSLLNIHFHLDTPNLDTYPVKARLGFIDNVENSDIYKTSFLLSKTSKTIEINNNSIYQIDIDISHNKHKYFFVYLSRCFVPANYGLSFDNRVLGLRIDKLTVK